MKNIFSKSLYLQGLRKIRTAAIAMAIIIIAVNALVPIICIVDSQFDFPGMNRSVQIIEAPVAAPAGLGMILFAPLLTYIMFSYLNERRASDFYHSLPQKRICVYISFIAAILTWIAATLIASAILNAILWGIARYYSVSVLAMVMSTVTYFITALMLVGFMALAMTVTGTAVSNILVFILFALFIRAFGLFFLYGLQEVAPIFNVTNSWLGIFDFDFFLPLRLFMDFDTYNRELGFYDAGLLCYWAVVGILLLVAAGFFYHRRKSESATKSAPNQIMQHIYRIAVTFPFMMLMMFMILLDENFESYHLIFIVFAALVWIIYELLTTKKIKNVLKSAPLFLVPVLLSLGYVGSVYAARGVVYNTTPERDEIVSVQMDGGSNRYYGTWDAAIVYSHSVEDPDVLDMVSVALAETKETLHMTSSERYQQGYTGQATLTLELKSGKKVTYNLVSRFEFYNTLVNSDDLYALCHTLPPDEMIDSIHVDSLSLREYQNAIWAAFREDYAAMNDQEKAGYYNWNNRSSYTMTYIYINGTYRDRNFHGQYGLDPQFTPKAYALYMEYHNRENPPLKGLENVRDTLNAIENPENHLVSLEIIGTDKTNASIFTEDIRVIKEFLNTLEIDKHLIEYTTAKTIYEVNTYVDTDSANYYMVDENGLKQYVEVEDANYYINNTYYVTLSDEDIKMYYEIEKKYQNNQKNYETETVIVD
ncbi:MAG: ABC transporter permease [Clostridia bacterium]|nr:ABC transporter permease [Clostridia bacterium]